MWTPDIQLYNSASFDKQSMSQTQNVVSKDGYVIDSLPMVVKSTCKIDVTWFPFDEQKCLLVFGSWSASSQYLFLQLSSKAVNTDGFLSVC